MVKIRKFKKGKYKYLLRICPECMGHTFRYDPQRKEISCISCGLVILAPPEYAIIYPNFSYYDPETKAIVLDDIQQEQQ